MAMDVSLVLFDLAGRNQRIDAAKTSSVSFRSVSAYPIGSISSNQRSPWRPQRLNSRLWWTSAEDPWTPHPWVSGK